MHYKSFEWICDFNTYLYFPFMQQKTIRNIFKRIVGCIVGMRPIVRMWDINLWGEYPPWEVFPRDPSPYLRKFRRKPRKTPND